MSQEEVESGGRNSLKRFFEGLDPAYAKAPLPSKLLRKCVTGVNTTWGRPPSVCRLLEHFQNSFLRNTQGDIKLRWWKNDKELLIFVVCKFLHLDEASNQLTQFPVLTDEDWKALSHILGLSSFCLERQWKLLIHQSVREATWTQQEDNIIRDEVAKFSSDVPNWTQISDLIVQTTANRLYRTPKQVRARWFNYIDPSVNKKEWTGEEDKILLAKVLECGKKWASIAYSMGDRNENQVKNRYHHITKRWSTLKSELPPEMQVQPLATLPHNSSKRKLSWELKPANQKQEGTDADSVAVEGTTAQSKRNSDLKLSRELALVSKILQHLSEGRTSEDLGAAQHHSEDLIKSDAQGIHTAQDTFLNSAEGGDNKAVALQLHPTSARENELWQSSQQAHLNTSNAPPTAQILKAPFNTLSEINRKDRTPRGCESTAAKCKNECNDTDDDNEDNDENDEREQQQRGHNIEEEEEDDIFKHYQPPSSTSQRSAARGSQALAEEFEHIAVSKNGDSRAGASEAKQKYREQLASKRQQQQQQDGTPVKLAKKPMTVAAKRIRKTRRQQQQKEQQQKQQQNNNESGKGTPRTAQKRLQRACSSGSAEDNTQFGMSATKVHTGEGSSNFSGLARALEYNTPTAEVQNTRPPLSILPYSHHQLLHLSGSVNLDSSVHHVLPNLTSMPQLLPNIMAPAAHGVAVTPAATVTALLRTPLQHEPHAIENLSLSRDFHLPNLMHDRLDQSLVFKKEGDSSFFQDDKEFLNFT